MYKKKFRKRGKENQPQNCDNTMLLSSRQDYKSLSHFFFMYANDTFSFVQLRVLKNICFSLYSYNIQNFHIISLQKKRNNQRIFKFKYIYQNNHKCGQFVVLLQLLLIILALYSVLRIFFSIESYMNKYKGSDNLIVNNG